MKILHLTLKKQWFDMIASGEKKEEYREIKEYWCKRFVGKEWFRIYPEVMHRFISLHPDVIQFRNGYAKDAPTITVECKGITIGDGLEKWGAEPFTEYFVIKLGNIINK